MSFRNPPPSTQFEGGGCHGPLPLYLKEGFPCPLYLKEGVSMPPPPLFEEGGMSLMSLLDPPL